MLITTRLSSAALIFCSEQLVPEALEVLREGPLLRRKLTGLCHGFRAAFCVDRFLAGAKKPCLKSHFIGLVAEDHRLADFALGFLGIARGLGTAQSVSISRAIQTNKHGRGRRGIGIEIPCRNRAPSFIRKLITREETFALISTFVRAVFRRVR